LENNEIIDIIINAINDKKGFAIEILDIAQLTSIADFFIICEGSSHRHLKTLGDEIIYRLKKRGVPALSVEGFYDGSGWILIDFGSIVVHLFDEERRRQIRLEEFWTTELKKIKN